MNVFLFSWKILTDATLLKRQEKEIEELRAKLHESHSEHWAEEILDLRNTLPQTELERERKVLELEEKKAQAEREKMVQQKAKKIENLSSMVLYSNRDATHDHFKKRKGQVWEASCTWDDCEDCIACKAEYL
ncbi:kinesin-like protein KIN-7O [Prunus yedoensis var. nudiflora]|uniref:Kinesin-like protein KIN-7O n=1 Tax=Prunus yedoensis var. nudiflora TaxID=2094558 RepID=A0A314Z1X9_PRUYE|nr:kinesin-like protein KIN-7O [Prunus yedoensis var. nudiflora]